MKDFLGRERADAFGSEEATGVETLSEALA